VLRCILRHCGVPVSTPHSSGFARLEFEAFYFVAHFPTFYGIIDVVFPGFLFFLPFCGEALNELSSTFTIFF
jgi:hypothetical protein